MKPESLKKLRLVINENLRVQRGGAETVSYIDVSNAFNDIAARQNHAVFGRRGCGKTLLLHSSAAKLPPETRRVYLNCEDFKKHSFPNVLIEILDALFAELESQLTGWFGKKKRSRDLIVKIREELSKLRRTADRQRTEIREAEAKEQRDSRKGGIELGQKGAASVSVGADLDELSKVETERKYSLDQDKIKDLDIWLPRLKQQVREFFELSTAVRAVYLQIDDFYHLAREDQPLVMDYIHRLCKDLPLYFKVATLRHASTLYADRQGQPLGAQERHDYQPINIDFTLSDFTKTAAQNRKIFIEFGRLAALQPDEIDGLFKGEGFERLVLAGGGVPRDCLSLFLEVLDTVQPPNGDGRIGKDDVRILSRSNFEHRIEELKQDSEGREQIILIKGIYVLREYCIDKKAISYSCPRACFRKTTAFAICFVVS
jgi:energy-coupling factor transporter ATP-binding protein EcfA2